MAYKEIKMDKLELKKIRVRYALQIIHTAPAIGLFEIANRMANILDLKENDVKMALLLAFRELEEEETEINNPYGAGGDASLPRLEKLPMQNNT